MKKKFIVATRPSLLASTQTEQTVNLLRAKNPGLEFEIIKFSTQGDLVSDKPLLSFGGTGVFVKELENALIQGNADFAIHSLKDVPSFVPETLTLASFPKREDPRDIIIFKDNTYSSDLKALSKQHLVIGTGSPRRIVQLSHMFKKAEFKDLRGNIDTRLRKLSEGQYDAIILAAAGINRLGKDVQRKKFLDQTACLPAVGQGIIGIECRKNDEETIEVVRSINDTDTEIAVKAERGYMIEMEGNCKFPLAAYAIVHENTVTLDVMIGNPETKQMIRITDSAFIDKAEELGIKLAEKIRPDAEKLGIKTN